MTRDEVKVLYLWAVDYWRDNYKKELCPGNLINYVLTWAKGYSREELLEILREMTDEPSLEDHWESIGPIFPL